MDQIEARFTKEESNELITAKVVSMVVLGLASFILGVLPLKVTKWISIKSVNGDKNLLISLLLCFGGGVLLFTTFIHLQPEVRESFQFLESKKIIPTINHIPMSELIFCCGFFFVYLVEELVHVFLHRRTRHSALHRSLSLRYSKKDSNMCIPRVTLNKFDDGNISTISNSNKELLNSQISLKIEKTNHNHSHGHSHGNIDDDIKNSLSGFLVVIALSFHAVFEGLAVGLEDSVEKVWYLFAAIATHKLVIGFCVGIELVSSKTKTLLVILYIGTFALVTPLGIGIGLALTENLSNEHDISSVVLQGMAAGTLLYVVFFEVLARERGNKHSGIFQLLAILAGFFVMFALQFVTSHEHSHGGHSHEHEALAQHDHHHHDHSHLIN